jgi:hypothetical protein
MIESIFKVALFFFKMLGGEEKQTIIAVENNPANIVFAGQESNVTATTVAESNRVFSTPSAKKTVDASASFASPSLASPPSAVGGGNAASNILEWSATKLSSLVKNMVNSPSGNSNHIEGGAASPVLVDRKLQSLSLVDPPSSTMPMTTCSSASDIINISVALAEGVKSPEASNSQQEIYYSTPSSPANQMKKTSSSSETNFLTSPLQHVSSNINNKNSSINVNFLSSTKQQLMDEFDPLREKSGQNQSVCLLDLSNEFLAASAATPRSQIKYSEKDLNDLLQKDKERQEKEMEFLQLEICNLQQKYENSLAKKNEIEKVLENYQETMNKMIRKP